MNTKDGGREGRRDLHYFNWCLAETYLKAVLAHLHESHGLPNVALLDYVLYPEASQGGGESEDGQQGSGRGEQTVLGVVLLIRSRIM